MEDKFSIIPAMVGKWNRQKRDMGNKDLSEI